MFEPLTQTVSQLAVRWKCSPQDVLTHALERNWPLYFQFDGLVFDVRDTANRSGGNSKQVEAAARLKAEIDRAETTLARNSLQAQGRLKLTEWEDALTGDEICALRQATDLKKKMLELLCRAVERWNEERQRYQRNGAVRAAPATLQGVAEQGSVPFPIKAFHPGSPVQLVRAPDGNGQLYEGRMVALEDMRHPKDRLTADDLFASMEDVKAIEAANADKPESAAGARPMLAGPDTEPEQPDPKAASAPHEAAKGITKEQVLLAFGDLVKSLNLKKALGDGKGLFGEGGARTRRGTRGGRHDALWDPITLAVGLNEKYSVPMPHLKRAFNEQPFLRKWLPEWIDRLDLLGE